MKKKNKILTCLSAFLGVFVMLFSYFAISFSETNFNSASALISDNTRYTLNVNSDNVVNNTFIKDVFLFSNSSNYLVNGNTSIGTPNYETFNFISSDVDNHYPYLNDSYYSYLDNAYSYTLNDYTNSLYFCFSPIRYNSDRTSIMTYPISFEELSIFNNNHEVVKTYNSDNLSNLTNVYLYGFFNVNYIIDDLNLTSLSDFIKNYTIGIKFYGSFGANTQSSFLSFRPYLISLGFSHFYNIKNNQSLFLSGNSIAISSYLNSYTLSSYYDYINYKNNYYSLDNTNFNVYWDNYYKELYYNNRYELGYNNGYQSGLVDGANEDDLVRSTLFTFASYPFTLLSGFFNFNLFGVNLYTLLMSFVTVFLFIWIIKKII